MILTSQAFGGSQISEFAVRCGPDYVWATMPIVVGPSPRLGASGVLMDVGIVQFGGAGDSGSTFRQIILLFIRARFIIDIK